MSIIWIRKELVDNLPELLLDPVKHEGLLEVNTVLLGHEDQLLLGHSGDHVNLLAPVLSHPLPILYKMYSSTYLLKCLSPT